MKHRSPAGSPWTWCLAVLLLVPISVTLTSAPALWAPTSFENRNDARMAFGQAYKVARRIYGPRHQGELRVVLLGNSRIMMAVGNGQPLATELARLRPEHDVQVDNLAIFGASIEEIEIVSRHLAALDPDLVVLAIDGPDLLTADGSASESHPAHLFEIGWADGPRASYSPTARLDRWMRTLWPMYRFREFIRAALTDRVFPHAPEPDLLDLVFTSPEELFEITRGKDAQEAEAAYRNWLDAGTIESFITFISVGRAPYLQSARQRAGEYGSLSSNALGPRAFDALLKRLSRGPWQAVLVLMPRTSVIEQDTAQVYHRAELEAEATEVIVEAAPRWGIPVIDARRWIADEHFLDFDHLLPPSLSGFEKPLAQELSRAVKP